MDILYIKEVEKIEKNLQNPNLGQAHRFGSLRVLKNWYSDNNLKKEEGVEDLIKKLLANYDKK